MANFDEDYVAPDDVPSASYEVVQEQIQDPAPSIESVQNGVQPPPSTREVRLSDPRPSVDTEQKGLASDKD